MTLGSLLELNHAVGREERLFKAQGTLCLLLNGVFKGLLVNNCSLHLGHALLGTRSFGVEEIDLAKLALCKALFTTHGKRSWNVDDLSSLHLASFDEPWNLTLSG